MKILITNDDGFDAPGLQTLVAVLKDHHDLYVAAPHEGMSAMGHAITLKHPVHVEAAEIDGVKAAYRIWGTPADCSKIALIYLFQEIAFDVVLSGINNGGNIGTEVIYSGTFAAAHEAYRLQQNAIALSLTNPHRRVDINYLPAAKHVLELLACIHGPGPYFYNVNYPLDVETIEMVSALPGDVRYQELIHCEPSLGGQGMDISFDGLAIDYSEALDTDFKLLKQGKATIVPIGLSWEDQEGYEALNFKLRDLV